MFTLALLIGIYSYCILFLGIIGFLYRPLISSFTLLFILVGIFWKKDTIFLNLVEIKRKSKQWERKYLFLILIILFLFQVLVNVIGTLGPELGFDALWYHLMLPKLYLLQHRISYIPGGLLYYSAMPKVAEMVYVGALSFGNEILAKIISFCFGLLTCYVVYKLSRKFFNPLIAIFAVVIFYGNLVVAWESITAYIDLFRSFFEILALWKFIEWVEKKEQKYLMQTSIVLGLAITTKVLALGSVMIFVVMLVYLYLQSWSNYKPHPIRLFESEPVRLRSGHELNRMPQSRRSELTVEGPNPLLLGERAFRCIKNVTMFVSLSIVIPLPWFIFSFIRTGNPVFPFFSKLYSVSFSLQLFNPIFFVSTIWNLFMHAADPISPLYLVFLPLIIFYYPKFRKEIKIICLYSILAIIVWYFTPNTGGGRFILPYLPAFSIVCAGVINEFPLRQGYAGQVRSSKYELRNNFLVNYIFSLVVFISVISIGYRFAANAKYIPVLIGKETKSAFLTTHLNFSYGDFYDTDGYFFKHSNKNDRVLLYGFHNLYYVDFPFVDSSWLQNGEKFNYIATQHTKIPKQYGNWHKIYANQLTGVVLYKDTSKEDCHCEKY